MKKIWMMNLVNCRLYELAQVGLREVNSKSDRCTGHKKKEERREGDGQKNALSISRTLSTLFPLI